MARLFDAYLIADWTAAETRKLGDQSLWVGVAKRDVRFRLYTETHNVASRAEGEALIASLLADHRKRGDRVLVGFDFNRSTPASGWASRTPAGVACGTSLLRTSSTRPTTPTTAIRSRPR